MITFLCSHLIINVYLNVATAWYKAEGRHLTFNWQFSTTRGCVTNNKQVFLEYKTSTESYCMLKETPMEKKSRWKISKSVTEEEKTQQQRQQEEKFSHASLNILTVPEMSSQILFPLSQTSLHKMAGIMKSITHF